MWVSHDNQGMSRRGLTPHRPKGISDSEVPESDFKFKMDNDDGCHRAFEVIKGVNLSPAL